MNHEHYQELISLHIDNELDDAGSAELYAHLATCDGCRKFMRTMMNVRSRIAGQELAEVSPALDRRVIGIVSESEPAEAKRSWFAPLWWTRISIPLPAAASIAFLILVATLLVSPAVFSSPGPRSESAETTVAKLPPTVQGLLQVH